MKKILTFIIKYLLTGYQLELTSYVNGLKKNLRKANEQVEDQKIIIGNLESFYLPKRFKSAVVQINQLTPKARATFLHTLVSDLTDKDETIETLVKYVESRTKKVINEEYS